MSALTGRPIIQKHPRVEVKSLRDLFHALPCFATFPHDCAQAQGCDPCHYDWLNGGKGVGLKTSDHLAAAMCRAAHRMIDGKVGKDALPKNLRQYYWIEAFIATHDYLWGKKLLKVNETEARRHRLHI
jgi:hypothetical protein